MIYVDSTELRRGSKFVPGKEPVFQEVTGLEAATGADFLISAATNRLPVNVGKPPGSVLLKQHLKKGMLVQRKSGSDFLSSIDHLNNIHVRMNHAGALMCWLMVCGSFEPDAQNKVVCEGRTTGWHWNAYTGALDAWQLVGGFVHTEQNTDRCMEWMMRWNDKLPKYLDVAGTVLTERAESQKSTIFDHYPQRRTLCTFPLCGEVISEKIIKHVGGGLAQSLMWMSLPEADEVEGVGPTMRALWRKWLGLEGNRYIEVVNPDGPTINGMTQQELEERYGSVV